MIVLKQKMSVLSFLSLIILIVFVIFGNTSIQNELRMAEIILAPQKGDIYEIKKKHSPYRLYKVSSVVGDSVFVLTSHISLKLSGLIAIKKKGDKAYNGNIMVVLKGDLKTMLEESEIIEAFRE